jgi:hypothetical protein
LQKLEKDFNALLAVAEQGDAETLLAVFAVADWELQNEEGKMK